MTGIIILAAGESSRLGQPKQNLLFKGKTLLQHAIDMASGTACSPVVVVLGANADNINIGNNPNGTTLHNPNWQEGMASSIRMGINEMIKQNVDAAIIMLCDQPFADAELIDTIMQQYWESNKHIVACTYSGTIGVPALFDKAVFPALLKLQGHEGAKKILAAHPGEIALVSFEKGSVDIDTKVDYDDLISRLNVN